MNKSDWLNRCKKRPLTKEQARYVVAKASHSDNPSRQEKRIIWCWEHKAYHTTSKPKRTAAIIIGGTEA
jgi:hypothetical protein